MFILQLARKRPQKTQPGEATMMALRRAEARFRKTLEDDLDDAYFTWCEDRTEDGYEPEENDWDTFMEALHAQHQQDMEDLGQSLAEDQYWNGVMT
jgi:hypothetical protein